ncbi:MAG: NADH-quinone oxidoreductase subunit C, partial [Acidimicrobiales bacterium]
MTPLSSAAEPESAADDSFDTGRLHESMLGVLRQHLGDALVASAYFGGELCVRVERSAWRQAAEVCKAHLAMDYFCFVSGLDWLVNPDLSGEKVWDPEGGAVATAVAGAEDDDADSPAPDEVPAVGLQTGLAGGDTRFQVFARLYSIGQKVGITLKADLDESDPRVDSWVSLYRGADWHEREAWEMYGFGFD